MDAKTLEALAARTALFDKLVAWQDAEAAAAKARGEAMFMDKPDAWFQEPHWFCTNGHVSGRYLKCETRGEACLACHEPVFLGPLIGERHFAPILATCLRALATKEPTNV